MLPSTLVADPLLIWRDWVLLAATLSVPPACFPAASAANSKSAPPGCGMGQLLPVAQSQMFRVRA